MCQNPKQRSSGLRKGPQHGAVFQKLEDKMKLVTRFEAAALSAPELKGLLRTLFNELARSDAQSPDRRNALASIETVRRELTLR